MPAQLTSLNEGDSILLDKPIMLLGRHPECDVQINSRKISRRHCCIAQVGNHFVVRDLGSTNGVRINGVRVMEGQLQDGDELTIGNHRYRIEWNRPVADNGHTQRSVDAASLKAPAQPSDDQLESCDQPVPLEDPIDRTRKAMGSDVAPLPGPLSTPREGTPAPQPGSSGQSH